MVRRARLLQRQVHAAIPGGELLRVQAQGLQGPVDTFVREIVWGLQPVVQQLCESASVSGTNSRL